MNTTDIYQQSQDAGDHQVTTVLPVLPHLHPGSKSSPLIISSLSQQHGKEKKK